ncbi:MAG: nuclear transport factor 2 family protein [Congregibacter sp.]
MTLTCGVLLAASITISRPAYGADDHAAIRTAVFDYFEGINEVSRVRLERAFDSDAELKSVNASGALAAEPIADAIARWMHGDASTRRGEVLSVDLFGDAVGGQFARVVFDFDGAYIDLLTLAKLQGQWKIIDKVFVRK